MRTGRRVALALSMCVAAAQAVHAQSVTPAPADSTAAGYATAGPVSMPAPMPAEPATRVAAGEARLSAVPSAEEFAYQVLLMVVSAVVSVLVWKVLN